jgi:SAM-dependent methyltransferase
MNYDGIRLLRIDACPLCGSARHLPYEHTHTPQFMQHMCSDCGLLFIDTVVHPDDLGKFYNSWNDQRDRRDAKLYADRQVAYDLDRDFVYTHLGEKRHHPLSILDVGGAAGDFMARFDAKFARTVYDLDEVSLQKGRSLYPDILFTSDVNELQSPMTFDVVCFRGTLQYSANLHQTADWVRKILKPGGQIWTLAIPNRDALLAHVQKEHWALFNRHEHIVTLGRDHIRKLFGSQYLLKAFDLPYLTSPYQNYPTDTHKVLEILKGQDPTRKVPFFDSMMNIVLELEAGH